MASIIESTILQRLATIISELTWIKKVEYENIHITINDIPDHLCPYVQLISGPQMNKHVHRHIETEWTIYLEFIMRKNSGETVNQVVLLNRKQEIEEKIGEHAGLLDINGVQHIKYNSAINDIHLFDPYYLVSLDLSVLYNKPYTSSC